MVNQVRKLGEKLINSDSDFVFEVFVELKFFKSVCGIIFYILGI